MLGFFLTSFPVDTFYNYITSIKWETEKAKVNNKAKSNKKLT